MIIMEILTTIHEISKSLAGGLFGQRKNKKLRGILHIYLEI
jgi:hypothetical protein